VVTNRPGAFVLPGACYDDYANRGESENRNKELRDGLQADPPPDLPQQELPTEPLSGRQRRNWYNRRRKHDPLGEGQPYTWRTRLIKAAARVRQTSRRALVELSAS
jgi:hypothetical protein